MAASNQKVVTISKKRVNGKVEPYIQFNQKSMFIAMKHLNGNAFKLYCYFTKNQDKWTFELSSKHACEVCGFSRDTYNSAIEHMIKLGYLVSIDKEKNRWVFYELPEKLDEKIADNGMEFHF